MRKFALLIAPIAIVVFAGILGSTAHAAGDAKTDITALEHKLITATSGSQAISYYDDKDVVVYDFVPPLQYVGGKAVLADFNNFFDNAKDVKGTFLDLDVVTDGRLGIARSIQHFTWTGKDGKPTAATIRVTDCWHKVNGQWKIFHSHVSVPTDPATGKGEMDLKM